MKAILFSLVTLAAPAFAMMQLDVQKPVPTEVKLTITAESIQEVVYLPENSGERPYKIAIVNRPKVTFSEKVLVSGVAVDSLPFGDYRDTRDHVCQALGYGKYEYVTGVTKTEKAPRKVVFFFNGEKLVTTLTDSDYGAETVVLTCGPKA